MSNQYVLAIFVFLLLLNTLGKDAVGNSLSVNNPLKSENQLVLDRDKFIQANIFDVGYELIYEMEVEGVRSGIERPAFTNYGLRAVSILNENMSLAVNYQRFDSDFRFASENPEIDAFEIHTEGHALDTALGVNFANMTFTAGANHETDLTRSKRAGDVAYDDSSFIRPYGGVLIATEIFMFDLGLKPPLNYERGTNSVSQPSEQRLAILTPLSDSLSMGFQWEQLSYSRIDKDSKDQDTFTVMTELDINEQLTVNATLGKRSAIYKKIEEANFTELESLIVSVSADYALPYLIFVGLGAHIERSEELKYTNYENGLPTNWTVKANLNSFYLSLGKRL